MLSDPCQQTAIVSRQIRGAPEGAIGPMVGVLQDCAVFEPCPCIFRSDGKQRFDCLFGILEPEELELDSRKNQAQFCASWATLHGRRSNGLRVRIEGSPARTRQARGGERCGTVLPRLPPAADFQPPRAVPVRQLSLAPSALPDIEPPVADRRRVQAGERRGVATRSSIFAISPRVPPTAPTICCRPRLEGPPPTTR